MSTATPHTLGKTLGSFQLWGIAVGLVIKERTNKLKEVRVDKERKRKRERKPMRNKIKVQIK